MVLAQVEYLRSARAVRDRSGELYSLGLRGELDGLRVHPERLDHVVAETLRQIERTHPTGPIPIHGRLNHLRNERYDLTANLADRLGPGVVDFVIMSVLVDAGAGPAWRFEDPIAGLVGRSEGLALASLRSLEGGLYSIDETPFDISVDALTTLSPERFADAFQVSPTNPLLGLEGRVQLIQAFGRVLESSGVGSAWELFVRDCEPSGSIAAPDVLHWVLSTFSDIWPGRIEVGGFNLGDTWRHGRVGGEAPTEGLVPFHKLSQWLTYSLIEPFEALGIRIVEIDGLTGLAEYRNGGMLLELGFLQPIEVLPTHPLQPDHPLVVEWRALTICALDVIASELRSVLPPERRLLPLGALLEAGTWPLGRRLAFDRDPAGSPPLTIDSDGTVF